MESNRERALLPFSLLSEQNISYVEREDIFNKKFLIREFQHFFKETMDLQHKQSKTVSVTSMSFLSGDVNNFVVGSEDGSVFTGHRHGRYTHNIINSYHDFLIPLFPNGS